MGSQSPDVKCWIMPYPAAMGALDPKPLGSTLIDHSLSTRTTDQHRWSPYVVEIGLAKNELGLWVHRLGLWALWLGLWAL